MNVPRIKVRTKRVTFNRLQTSANVANQTSFSVISIDYVNVNVIYSALAHCRLETVNSIHRFIFVKRRATNKYCTVSCFIDDDHNDRYR